ncbi:MAG: hypothetical protein JW953_07010 [Anaerolineae bacterium]|nr:hypothetical protein [Anaerolineae bacterium]
MMVNALIHPPIIPLPEQSRWAQTLGQIAAAPLEFCLNFPLIAQRFEAWWNQDMLDRPIFIASANANPERPLTRRLELLDQPQAWLQAKLADLRQLHRVGDALPFIRIDFGAVLLGSLLGARREVGADTSWTHAFINDDWSNAPDWTISDDNADWQLLQTLLQRVADGAKGRYLVCTPDLGGSADVLLNLRGSGPLSLDMIDQPGRVQTALESIYPAWHRAFTALYQNTVGREAGVIHWVQLWSNQPYVVPACDFNALVSPQHFRELFLPDIARQAATMGRAVFHLDGPGATRHIDALLELSTLQAIQFTPGAGTSSALAWVEMFHKIQQQGRSVLVICPANEVLALGAALHPKGLAIWVDSALTPVELDDLFGQFCRQYGARSQ